MPTLTWKKTDNADEDVVFALADAPVTVGRDPACGVFIDAPLVSREHARIVFEEGRHVIEDLGSTNFTKVNGERIFKRALEDGDEVHFSRARCLYRA